MLKRGNFIHKLVCMSTLMLAVQNGFVFAQAQASQQPKSKPLATKCSGAWTGSVSYSRRQIVRNKETVPRVTNGKDEKQFNLNYDYAGKVFVTERPGGKGQSLGKASIDMTMSTIDKTIATERNSCDRGKTWQDMSGTFTIRSEKTGTGTGEAQVSVGVNSDGTYSVRVALPRIEGKTSGTTTATYKGQCTAKKGSNVTMPETNVGIDGNSLTSDGTHRIDPKTPNAVAGTYVFRNGDVVQKMTWSLQRCGAPLRITGVKFYEPVYPGPNDWGEIFPGDRRTIDGNLVKVVATVANFSGSTKTANLKFKELKANKELPGGTKSDSIEPNTEKDVEFVWDTSGYAWKDGTGDVVPEMNRQIEISMPEDTKTENIDVWPKPIVSVGGLWTKPGDHGTFIDFFKAVPGTKWVSGSTKVDKNKAAIDNAPTIDNTVRWVQKEYNAWHVDMTAHGTGGLAARAYINGLMPTQFDGRPTVSHLVMIGTPNKGTPCAVGFQGVIGRIFSRNADALAELTPSSIKRFNTMVRNRNGTKFTTIAGLYYNKTCQNVMPGDGAVPNGSAAWAAGSKDRVFTSRPYHHERMLSDVNNFKEVYKRLAIGPNGDHNPEVIIPQGPEAGTAQLETNDRFGHRNYGTSFLPETYESPAADTTTDDSYEDGKAPIFSSGLKLKPGEHQEISVPMRKGARAAITFMAPPKVTVNLLDASGKVVGSSPGRTPEADTMFRTIYVEQAFTEGTWKLRVESLEEAEAEFAVVVFVDDVALPATAIK